MSTETVPNATHRTAQASAPRALTSPARTRAEAERAPSYGRAVVIIVVLMLVVGIGGGAGLFFVMRSHRPPPGDPRLRGPGIPMGGLMTGNGAGAAGAAGAPAAR